MLFQTSRVVTTRNEMSRFISVSEYAAPAPSLLILACIGTLGANFGANQPAAQRVVSDEEAKSRRRASGLPGANRRPHLSSSGCTVTVSLIMCRLRPRPQAVAASRSVKLAESRTPMPALSRRRSPVDTAAGTGRPLAGC